MTYDFKSRIYAADILKHPWFKLAPAAKIDMSLMKSTLANMSRFNAN
jgi:hypothetical protein